MVSFISTLSGITPVPSPFKFCFWNIPTLIQKFSTGGSFNTTQWLMNQFIVSGNTFSNMYIQDWTPTSMPGPNGEKSGSGGTGLTLAMSVLIFVIVCSKMLFY